MKRALSGPWLTALCLTALSVPGLTPVSLAATPAPSPLTAPADKSTLPTRWTNALGMEFVLIPGGPTRFGYRPSPLAAPGEPAAEDYIVWLSKDYYLQTTEVTRRQWQVLMGDAPCPAGACPGPAYPVQSVSTGEIDGFIARLRGQEHLAYRLPTLAEWERAAMAGQARTRYWWGSDERRVVKYENCLAPGDERPWLPFVDRDGYAGPAPVASFRPNAWGLYDMLGNVSELTVQAPLLWDGERPAPAQHFADEPGAYVRAYTDFPHNWYPDYPYRLAAGSNYRRSRCDLTAGSGLIKAGTDAMGPHSSPTVGFRLLLEAASVRGLSSVQGARTSP